MRKLANNPTIVVWHSFYKEKPTIMQLKNLIPLFIILTFSILSCKKKEIDKDEEPISTDTIVVNDAIYSGCCSDTNTIFQFGEAKAYVPNMVTANNDGINDVFLFFGNSEVKQFEDIKIFDRADSVIFAKANLLPNAFDQAWNAKINGEFYQGKFSYEATLVNQNNETLLLAGTACIFTCDTTSTVIQDLTNCQFPDQYNPDNETINGNTLSLSYECFEE